MKILKQSFENGIRPFQCYVFLLFFAGIATQSQAVLLTHNNSSLNIDLSGPSAGLSNWLVDGGNQLNYQWFYYRVGGQVQEFPVNNISAPVITTQTAQRLDVVYDNLAYSVSVRFILTGGQGGSGGSGLSETITLVNSGVAPLEFHFFQYSDFDLHGIAGGQSVQFTANPLGQYFKAVQTDASSSVTETVTSGAVPIGHVEAGTYGPLLTSLLDFNVTTLNDNLSAGPGDAIYAYEWDLTINPGGSAIISKIMTVVPEPSSLTLVSLGVVGFGLLRRRGRKA